MSFVRLRAGDKPPEQRAVIGGNHDTTQAGGEAVGRRHPEVQRAREYLLGDVPRRRPAHVDLHVLSPSTKRHDDLPQCGDRRFIRTP